MQMGMKMRIVNLLDGKDAAVHHVGGGNNVCTSLGKNEIILSARIIQGDLCKGKRLAGKGGIACLCVNASIGI